MKQQEFTSSMDAKSVVRIDPDDLFIRICVVAVASDRREDFSMSEILQDGFTLSCLDTRKFTPVLESPANRRINMCNVCETFGVSKSMRRHLLHRGFRSTALLALVDELDCAAICSQSPNCTDGDSKGLELAVSKLRDYPLEPVHSFLRIAQFRESEIADKQHLRTKTIRQMYCYNLDGPHTTQRIPYAKGAELYEKADVNGRHNLIGKCTFWAKSYFPTVRVSTLKDITARGSPDATPTLAPDVSCHRGPVASNAATAGAAAAAATAAPVTRPFFFSTPPPPILPAHPIPQVYGPPSVLFVPVPSYASPFQPFVMTAASTPPPPMPPPEVVVTTDVTPSRQAAPRPARSSTTVDCGYLTALGKSPASAGSRSSSSRSRSCSSNSLKSGYDAGEWPPTTPNIRKGKQNSTLHNYCPFINCKFYVRDLTESLTDHLRDSHNNFTVVRKAQKFEVNEHGVQEKRIEDYWTKQRLYHGASRANNPAYSPDYWQRYNRLGQVEEAVEFRFFNPEYFWWGPKLFVFDGLEFFVIVFKLQPGENDHPTYTKNGQVYRPPNYPRMVFFVQVNASDSVSEAYGYSVELPDKGDGTWKPPVFRGRVFGLTGLLPEGSGCRDRPDYSHDSIRKMVYFYKKDLVPHVSPQTGKIHFTLGLYKIKDQLR